MSERGLLVVGELVPGTDWIRRDPSAWWAPQMRGTRKRAPVTDLLVGHWTAGYPRTTDAGPKVVRSMRARERDGRPLNVGIHFVIGWDGQVWQTADPGRVATVHVGRGEINARSIGVECCWPGTVRQARRLGVEGPGERARLPAGPVDVLLPSADLIGAWCRLADTLAGLDGRGGVRIPRQVPEPLTGRLSVAQSRRWQGALEHLSVPGTTKIDAAGLLLGALLDAGWEAVRP